MFGSGTEVGSVFTRLAFRVEDAAANAYERKVEKLRGESRRDIVQHAKVDADTTGATRYERKLRDIDRGHNDVVRGSARARVGMLSFGAASSGAAVGAAAVGAGLFVAGREIVGFDKAMRNVNSIAQLNEKQLGSLTKSVRELAVETGQSPTTLADGLYDLVSSGFDADQSLTILKSTAKAATAGLTDTATSTQAVAAVLNAYHLSAKDAAAVSDDLFQTVNRGVISFPELAQNIGDVLPFASSLGVGLKEVGAATATMTKAGVSGAETMTRIKGVLSALISPSKDLTAVYDKLGVSSGEELIKKQGSLQGAIQAVTQAVGGNKTEIAKLFPDIRALGGVLLLSGKNAKGAGADLKAFKNDAGATNTALAEQSKSAAFGLNRAKAALFALADGAVGVVSPAINKVSVGFADFVGELIKGEGAGGRVSRTISSGARTIGSTIRSAIGGAKTILTDNRDRLEDIADTVLGVAKVWIRSGQQIIQSVRQTFGSGSGVGRDLRTIISALLAVEGVFLKFAANIAKRILPGIVQELQGFALIIRGIIRVIAGILSGDFGKAWDGVKDIFRGALKSVGGIIRTATAPLRAGVAGLGSVLGAAFSAVWSGILGTATGFVNKIIDVINILPGVNIGHVGGGSKSIDLKGIGNAGSEQAPGGRQTTPTAKTSGAYRTGGRVTHPVAIMGEEAPEHPEWVIPTNPAYRKRAVGLWMATARDLGIPGFSIGGLFKGAAKGVASVAGGIASIPGRVLDTAGHLAGYLAGKLPGNPGGIIKPTFSYALDKAKDYIGDKAKGALSTITDKLGLTGGGGAGAGTGGLVAQVIRALAWARAHGWHGSVISGYRSPAAQIIAGTNFARRLGKSVAEVYPNGLLSSSHTTGQAVDVTDPAGFAAALRDAPPGSRITNAIPWDPAHFSVSGHRKGGILGLIGGDYGGERIAGGTFAFKKGGKTPARKAHGLSKKDSVTITRSVQRGERGIAPFETKIQTLERQYGQADSRFDLSEEEFVTEHDDGSTTINQEGIDQRTGEIDQLLARRRKIKKTILAYRKKITAAIAAFRAAIAKLKKAIAAASGKKLQKDRAAYRERITGYAQRVNELQGTFQDLGLDVEDQNIDLASLKKERATVSGTTGKAADPEDPAEPTTYTAAEQGELDRLDSNIALAKLTPGTDDDKAAQAAKAAFLKPILDAATANGGDGRGGFGAITQIAGDYEGTQPTEGSSSDGSSGSSSDASTIAEQVIAELANFQNARHDLFATFGANVEAGRSALARLFGDDPSRAAAGARSFGAFGSPDDGRRPVEITNHFAAPPPDPHVWAAQQRFEVEGVF